MPKLLLLWLILSTSVAATQAASAAGDPAAMLKRFEALEARILELENEVARLKGEQPAPEQPPRLAVLAENPNPPPRPKPAEPQKTAEPAAMAEILPSPGTESADFQTREVRMPLSGYMEYHFNKLEEEPGRADFHRFTLLYAHRFNDRIQFWSEVELEHAIVEGGRAFGEFKIEQAYLDFSIKPWLNVRSGVMLTPVGLINERNEPPMFNGVERPFVDTVILPSTWYESGAGLHGDLGKGFRYKAYVMAPLNSSFFDAEQGIRAGRQRAFQSVAQNPAFTGRLEYYGLPGLSLGVSGWSGKSGFETPGINPRVNVFEFDGRFSVSRFDVRGQFAQVTVDQTARLNSLLQRTSGVNPNIAERMRGYYFEGAYHVLPPSSRYDLVAFSRYESFDTQNRMARGFLPLGELDRDAFVSGVTFFPEPDVALKLDYTILRNQSSFIRARNGFNLGVGWWF